MDLYRAAILDHYKHPRNFGHLDDPDSRSEESNVSCGDKIYIEAKFKVSRSKSKVIVEDIRFSGEGCAINIASASMLTEKVKQIPIEDVMRLGLGDVQKLLGTTLTPSRVKCGLLPLEAIQKAVMRIKSNM